MCKVINIEEVRKQLNVIDNNEKASIIAELKREIEEAETEIKKLKSLIAINKGAIKDLENAENPNGPLGIA